MRIVSKKWELKGKGPRTLDIDDGGWAFYLKKDSALS